MLSEVKTGRAHQVADILDKQNIDLMQIELMQRRVHHVCVQVAGAAGGYLNGLDAACTNAFSVVLRFEVALDHRNSVFVLQRVDGCFQQRCFACAR